MKTGGAIELKDKKLPRVKRGGMVPHPVKPIPAGAVSKNKTIGKILGGYMKGPIP